MNVYTFEEAEQNLLQLLERASLEGEIQLKSPKGELFALKPVSSNRSPLDVDGVDLNLSRDEIVACIREGREGRNYR